MGENKLLLLELNEVPYRVIEAFQRRRPGAYLSRLLARSAQYVTVTEDHLALDPWISWPTLHRGVTDETHQILHLGQVLEDVDAQFPPIWRLLKGCDLRVGVFGSLHSSSIPSDVGEYCFYLPDYFDDKVFAHPAELLPFQELNLRMTRQSARNVARRLPLKALARFLATAPRSGLTWDTVVDSATHLARETLDRSLRVRRRAYQPIVMADLFLRQLELTQPDFATFYTNHVAAAMHRYWGASFPEDYERPLDAEWIGRYEGEIRFAMDKFDLILGRILRFIDAHPEYTLVVASSMGQAAIPAEKTFHFLTIVDLPRFMAQLGVPPEGWRARPAMIPCQCVVVDEPYRERVLASIASLSVHDTRIRKDRRPIGPMSYDERHRGFFQFFVQFDSYSGPPYACLGTQRIELAELGLGLMAHEDGVNCTAQHVPEGSLIVYRADAPQRDFGSRDTISTTDVAPSIMRYFGLATPTYMRGSSALLSACAARAA